MSRRKDLYIIFVDLEKAFDRIPREALWWAVRKLGVEERIIGTVKSLYEHAKSVVSNGCKNSAVFAVDVGLHQGSVFSPLLFNIVMEAISQDFCQGCPRELLYADDLVITADSVEDLRSRFLCWKSNLESKGMRINIKKTKLFVSRFAKIPLKDSGKFPCGVCRKGVGRNSIRCSSCRKWIHQRCTGLSSLRDDPDFECRGCKGELPECQQRLQELTIGSDSFEVVNSFCYQGDMLDSSGGCSGAVSARIRSAWKSFHDLLPVLTNRSISLRCRGHVFESCVRSVLLYAAETWPLRKEEVARLTSNENAMVRWICAVKLCDRRSMTELRQMLGLHDMESSLRRHRLRWFGHLERMAPTTWPKKALELK